MTAARKASWPARVAGSLAAAAWLWIADARAEPPKPATVDLPVSILERYTGAYRVGSQLVLTITRQGEQLYAQLTGQPAAAIYPETVSSFVYRVVDARIDFIPNPPAQIDALVLHQGGNDLMAPRIDAAEAQQLQSAVAGRVQAQAAAPGSEQAARRLLAGLAAGAPDYAMMSPALASATRQQLPQLKSVLDALGAVQSVSFQGVGNQGWDLYLIRHEHGTSQLRILVQPDGIIAGALLSAGP
jgi:hypothetical protein